MTGDPGRREAGHELPGGLPPGPAPLVQDFDAGSLYALRSAVAAHAAAAGLSPDRVYNVMAAAHELAANAVRHGAGRGRLRLQAADGTLTCQVSDAGPAAADRGLDQEAAELPWPVQDGHGLWMVGQVADLFTIDHGPAGTTATATFTLRPSQ
jgi:anti-sigma regulatory factor (Ser/Thr protein kinase)